MLSCMRVGIGMSLCVLVLAVVLVWMLLMVRIVVGVLAVIVATVMVQEVFIQADCVGVVFRKISRDFFVVVALKDFGLMLWPSWRIALWCWNERGTLWDVSV